MTMGRSRFGTVDALLVATIVMLAGCSGGAGRNAAGTVSVIASDTAHAGTARVDVETIFPGQPTSVKQGVYDFTHHLGEIFPSTTASGAGNYEVIVDRSNVYLQVPFLPQGKRWIVQQLEQPGNVLLSLYLSPANPDVSSLLKGLGAVLSSIEPSGNKSIDGVSTTEYKVVVDPNKVIGRMKVTSQQKQETEQSFGPAHPVLIWTDSESRLRRVQVQLAFPGVGTMTSIVTYSDFGIPVSISPPPADQVVTRQQLQQWCAGSSSQRSSVVSGSNLFKGSSCGTSGATISVPSP